ncbi:MAG: hypothetical protein KDC92_03725 [Bacteroidetes bacterium]|nr:hypothetical protein [Bacteroidota bacterium]
MKKATYLALVALLAIGFVSCGESSSTATTDSDKTEDTSTQAADANKEEETPEPAGNKWNTIDADKVEATIEIAATGETMAEMAYSPAEITAPAYTYVQLNFKNTSSADGMDHNVVIIDNDESIANAIRGNTDVNTGFGPKADDRIHAYTDMMKAGQSTSIGFETPGPGEYLIICTFPGNTAMTAKMVVQ